MPPFFNPGPNPYGPPVVALAAVGTRMTEVAGEVADALLCHGFTTERYLRTVTLPAVARGQERADSPRRVDICIAPFVVTGMNEAEFEAAAAAVRNQVAFYASTPAYRTVLEAHGWGDLQTELLAMTKANRWSEMGSLIDDEVLAAFAVVGEPAEVGPLLTERFGDIADRISLYVPYDAGTALEPVVRYLLAADSRKS
jgi:probable F420-dependent oxidoreductase